MIGEGRTYTQLAPYCDHWHAPMPNGTPRTIEQQFRELEREGIAGLYGAMAKVAGDILGGKSEEVLYWGELWALRDAWEKSNGGTKERGRGGPQYGVLWEMVRFASTKIVKVERKLSAGEADFLNCKEGDTIWVNDLERSTEDTAEGMGNVWVRMYVQMVRDLLGDDPNDETVGAFSRLYTNLKGYILGAKEDYFQMEQMKADSRGTEVLTMFQVIREQLNTLLDEIADEHLSQPEPNLNMLTWKGNTQELAVLIDLLEKEGWIDGGRSRSQLATRVASLFIRSDGLPLELATLKTYMGKAYKPEPREGVKFTATRNPDKT